MISGCAVRNAPVDKRLHFLCCVSIQLTLTRSEHTTGELAFHRSWCENHHARKNIYSVETLNLLLIADGCKGGSTDACHIATVGACWIAKGLLHMSAPSIDTIV